MDVKGTRSIEIEFCVPCDLRADAVAAVQELLASWVHEIRELRLVPGTGGRFEVSVDGVLLFSKAQLGRTPEPGELAGLLGAVTAARAGTEETSAEE
jgi:selenoprotein W-related protein